MSQRIINIAEVELQPRPPRLAPTGAAAQRFEARSGMIAARIGAKKLGYNPGKRAFPFHNHRLNEEMFYVIEGSGEVRIASETFPIRAVSTMERPEVCEYPDSGKIAVLGESIRYVSRLDSQARYWDGE